MIASLLVAMALGAPLGQAAARAAEAGGTALVIDARDGRELAAAGPVERPLPPGSLFKIVTTLAAGEAAAPALRGPLRCPAPAEAAATAVTTGAATGTAKAAAATLPRCAVPGGGHGALPLEEALAQSCNAYFGQVGRAVGDAALRRTAARLGVGAAPGRAPEPGAAAAEVGAHGAGALITARQAARLLRAVALGRLPDGALPGGEVLPRLRAGLRAAVERGTATGAAAPGEAVSIAGKTGTAAAGGGTVGWFAGYAPAAAPSIIVVVSLRGSGREAARAARPLFEAYFHGR